MIGGKISGTNDADLGGFTLELVNPKTQWRSGKIALSPDGVFMANLHAERNERNTFLIELFDARGQRQKTTPDQLSYTIGAVVDEQPIINSMGIALANNEYDKLFEKGRGLPLKATRDYRTVNVIRQGQSADVFKIPVIEGENEKADRNRLVGSLEIRGENIRRDLPAGSEVEVTLRMDESRILKLTAYVPLLDEEFPTTIDLKKQSPKAADLQRECDAEMQRMRELDSKAAAADGDSAKDVLEKVEASNLLEEVKEALSAAKGDPDAAAKCEKRLLELKLKLDEASDALEWPALVAEANEWSAYLKKIVDQHGTQQQTDKSEDLIEQVRDVIRDKRMDRLDKKIEQIKSLYYEILFAQPGFWVGTFNNLDKEKNRMNDQARSGRLLDQGRDCIAKNNITGLQNVVRQLWDLLPSEVVEQTRRGYQSGLVR
jgi:molecular chaperone DnaK